MTAPQDFQPDPVLAAIQAEHFASERGYRPPAEVETARKALRDLLDRTEGPAYSRDEKRLIARYKRVIEAHHDDLVAKHFSTAPNASKEQVR